MNLIINGETIASEAQNVTDLLAALNIDPKRVAVELNLDILPKPSYGETRLNDGDRLEIVHFVGGG